MLLCVWLLLIQIRVSHHDNLSICWPFILDQVTNAARVSDKLQTGYELFQARSGPGLQASYRLGKAPEGTLEAFITEAQQVLSKAFGDDGMRKLANAERLQQQIAQAWSENGSSRKAVNELIASMMQNDDSSGFFGSLTSWL